MKKTVCLLMVVLMVLSVILCSCNNNSGDASDDSAAVDPNAYVPHLGATDKYNGKTLKILASAGDTADSWHAFCKEALDPDASTGEPVNDAAYERNQKIKDCYGITIETIWSAAFAPSLNIRRKND